MGKKKQVKNIYHLEEIEVSQHRYKMSGLLDSTDDIQNSLFKFLNESFL